MEARPGVRMETAAVEETDRAAISLSLSISPPAGTLASDGAPTQASSCLTLRLSAYGALIQLTDVAGAGKNETPKTFSHLVLRLLDELQLHFIFTFVQFPVFLCDYSIWLDL